MLRVLDMKYNIFSILTQVLGRFFKDRDPDFWPIRIRTQKKKSDPDPGRKKTDPKHSFFGQALVI